MPIKVIKKTREVVDGVEYNVTYLKSEIGSATVYDPVRTPEQQAKRDETLRRAAADYARMCIRDMGLEWAKEHLLERVENGKDGMERAGDYRGNRTESERYSATEAQ